MPQCHGIRDIGRRPSGRRKCYITVTYTTDKFGPLLYWIKLLLWETQQVKLPSGRGDVLDKSKASPAV